MQCSQKCFTDKVQDQVLHVAFSCQGESGSQYHRQSKGGGGVRKGGREKEGERNRDRERQRNRDTRGLTDRKTETERGRESLG